MPVTNRTSTILRLVMSLFMSGMCQMPLAYGGDIHGKVTFKRRELPESSIISRSIIQRYADRRLMHNRVAATKDSGFAVVYLTGLSDSSLPAADTVVVMDQRNERFIPHVLPIVAGTSVRFLNSEEVYHNVFSLSPAKSFDLGRYPKGQFRDVRFDKIGVVSVYCDIHTHMNAFILVLPNRYFATPDKDGHYVIENVPAGSYELRVWHGRQPGIRRNIHVPEDGDVVANLVLP